MRPWAGLVASLREQWRYMSCCFQSPLSGLWLLFAIFGTDLALVRFCVFDKGSLRVEDLCQLRDDDGFSTTR